MSVILEMAIALMVLVMLVSPIPSLSFGCMAEWRAICFVGPKTPLCRCLCIAPSISLASFSLGCWYRMGKSTFATQYIFSFATFVMCSLSLWLVMLVADISIVFWCFSHWASIPSSLVTRTPWYLSLKVFMVVHCMSVLMRLGSPGWFVFSSFSFSACVPARMAKDFEMFISWSEICLKGVSMSFWRVM